MRKNIIAGLVMACLMSVISAFSGVAAEYTVTPENINQVLMTCGDSQNNPVVINMTPGTYGPIVLRDRKHYISLIGNGNVQVISPIGLYAQPAAELWLDGEVRNVTFISSHPAGAVNTLDKGAYAVHMDWGQQNATFESCKFISYQTAAVGMGISAESNVVFKNCSFANKADGTFGQNWQLGAVYAHTDVNDYNRNGAVLSLTQCTYEAPAQAYADVVSQELNGSKLSLFRT